jgi:hypothetical protein
LKRALATTLAAAWPAYWAHEPAAAAEEEDGRAQAELACALLPVALEAMAEVEGPEAVLAYTALAELGDGWVLRSFADRLGVAAPWAAPDRGSIAAAFLHEDVVRWCRAHGGELELSYEDRSEPAEASLRAPVVSVAEFGAMVASNFRDACGAYRAFLAEPGRRGARAAAGPDAARAERAAAALLLADCRSLAQIHRTHGLAVEVGTGTEALALALAVARSWYLATWQAEGLRRRDYVWDAGLVAAILDDPDLGAWLQRATADPAELQGTS